MPLQSITRKIAKKALPTGIAACLSAALAACQMPEAPESIVETPAADPAPSDPNKIEKSKATLRGYIDKKGNWVIEPQFVTGGSFSEGLAHVVDPRGSYIDKKGKFVITEKYYLGGDFHEGLAWAAKPNSKWSDVNCPGDQLTYGYIDKTGKFVIEPRFRAANDFSDGMAMVMPIGENKWGFINRAGKLQIKPQFEILIDEGSDNVPQFRNGTAYVSLEHNKSFSIDKNGKPLSKDAVQKAFVASFPDGMGKWHDTNGAHGGAWGYIDRAGKVIPCIYDKVTAFSDGLALVRIEGKKWGFIDKTGKMVIPATRQYEFLSFHDGMAQFRERGGMVWGYMDKTGKMVIEPKFPNSESFSEGLAAADWAVPQERINQIKLPFTYTVQGASIVFPMKFDDSKESEAESPQG